MISRGRLAIHHVVFLLIPILAACNNRQQEQSQSSEADSRGSAGSTLSRNHENSRPNDITSTPSNANDSSRHVAKDLLGEVRHCAGISAIAFSSRGTETNQIIAHKWAWGAYLIGRSAGLSHEEAFSGALISSEKYALAITGSEEQRKASRKLVISLPEETLLCQNRSNTIPTIKRALEYAEKIMAGGNNEETLQRIAYDFVNSKTE